MDDAPLLPSCPLHAHSLAEVYLYLMATPCPGCGKGPLRGADARGKDERDWTGVTVDITCTSCGAEQSLTFSLPQDPGAAGPRPRLSPPSGQRINPSPEASRIIDVVGWVMLARVITEAAAKTSDKAESRLLGYEAAQCFEEALKFFQDDNDLPPAEAAFAERSRRLIRTNPQLFTRSRLLDLRNKLPALAAMEKRRSAPGKKRKWWRFGRS